MDLSELFPWLVGGGGILGFSLLTAVCACVPGLLIAGGAVYFVGNMYKKRNAANKASLTWPSTTGTVLKSRVEVSGGEHTSVYPMVRYEYTVGGTKYQNDRIQAGDRFARVTATRTAYDTVDRYPEGASVTVYYNPENPAESALER